MSKRITHLVLTLVLVGFVAAPSLAYAGVARARGGLDIAQAGTVQFSSATYTVGESAGPVNLTVTRSGGTVGQVTVNYFTVDGTASSVADYHTAAGQLVFPDGGADPQIISVDLRDDSVGENAETFTVRLELEAGSAGALGSPSTATVTITDNDPRPGTVQFKAATYSATEGDGVKVIYVSRTGGSDGVIPVTVSRTGGTADASEYVFNTQTITFGNADVADKAVPVVILDDTEVDTTAPTVILGLDAGDPGLKGSPATTTLSILDNDGVQPGTFYFKTATKTVQEDTTATIEVWRKNPTSGLAASVSYSISEGTADVNDDYEAVATGTLSFTATNTYKTISVDIVDDDDPEIAETFFVDLTGTTTPGALIDQAAKRLTVTIASNDQGTVQFSPYTYSVDEDADYVTLTVVRSTDEGAATVDYETVEMDTGDEFATEDEDYDAKTGTVSFTDGQNKKTLKIDMIDDNDEEEDEKFQVLLSDPTGASLGTRKTATVTIKDNDGGVIEFSSSTYSANENAGVAVITVKRTGGESNKVTVKYSATDLTGRTGVDYMACQGTLTFDEDVTSQTFSVSLIDDIVRDGNKTVKLTLSDPSTGVTLGTKKTATLTIVDNDNEVVVTLTVGLTGANIGGRSYTLDVKPYINQRTGRTMVPLRFIAEAFGAAVNWTQTTRTVTIDLGNTHISMAIGATTATVNGQSKPLDAPAELIPGGRTMVPIRFISENLGATVDYNSTTKVISIRR